MFACYALAATTDIYANRKKKESPGSAINKEESSLIPVRKGGWSWTL